MAVDILVAPTTGVAEDVIILTPINPATWDEPEIIQVYFGYNDGGSSTEIIAEVVSAASNELRVKVPYNIGRSDINIIVRLDPPHYPDYLPYTQEYTTAFTIPEPDINKITVTRLDGSTDIFNSPFGTLDIVQYETMLIEGNNFDHNSVQAIIVTIAGVELNTASILNTTSSSLEVRVPGNTSSGDLIVYNNGIASNVVPLNISTVQSGEGFSVSTTTGKAGDIITISAIAPPTFEAPQKTLVKFDGIVASITETSNNYIKVRVPSKLGVTDALLTVETFGNVGQFFQTGFTIPPSIINKITKTDRDGNTTIYTTPFDIEAYIDDKLTIEGSGFSYSQEWSNFSFVLDSDKMDLLGIPSDTFFEAKIPLWARSGKMWITNDRLRSNQFNFTLLVDDSGVVVSGVDYARLAPIQGDDEAKPGSIYVNMKAKDPKSRLRFKDKFERIFVLVIGNQSDMVRLLTNAERINDYISMKTSGTSLKVPIGVKGEIDQYYPYVTAKGIDYVTFTALADEDEATDNSMYWLDPFLEADSKARMRYKDGAGNIYVVVYQTQDQCNTMLKTIKEVQDFIETHQ